MKTYRVEWQSGDMTGTMVIGAICASHIIDKMELLRREVRRLTLIRKHGT